MLFNSLCEVETGYSARYLTVGKFFSSSTTHNCPPPGASHRDHSPISLLSGEEQVRGGAGILLVSN